MKPFVPVTARAGMEKKCDYRCEKQTRMSLHADQSLQLGTDVRKE